MSEELNQGVTQGAAEAPAASPAVEKTEKVEQPAQDTKGSSSAETLKAETNQKEQYVPYTRFEQINRKNKELQEQLEEYNSFAKALEENPRGVIDTLKKHFGLTEAEAKAVAKEAAQQEGQTAQVQPNNDLDQIKQQVGFLTNQFQQQQIEAKAAHVDKVWDSYLKDVPAELKSQYEKSALAMLVEQYGSMQQAFIQMNDANLKGIFDKVHAEITEMEKALKASYLKSKTSAVPSSRGQIVKEAPVQTDDSHYSRAAKAMDFLKRSGQL